MENRQAVTNRLKPVMEFLNRAFEEKRDENAIRLLSIASGSARAVIGAMQKAPHLNARAHLPENSGRQPLPVFIREALIRRCVCPLAACIVLKMLYDQNKTLRHLVKIN
jgi:hypothetical protein